MANRDDWRSRGNSRDEEERDYYRYDSRDGYDNRRGPNRPSRRGSKGRGRNRPSSSNSDYRDERDGYGSDNSTCSEPAPDDRKHSTNPGKPFSKNPPNSQKPKSEPRKSQTQTLPKDEKAVNSKQDNPGSKTDNNSKRSEPAPKKKQQEKNKDKDTKPPAPPTSPPNTSLPSTHNQEQPNKTMDPKANKTVDPKAVVPPKLETNIPPKKDTNIPTAQGGHKSADNKADTPPTQGESIPSKKEANVPTAQGENIPLKPETRIPLAQGENKSSGNKVDIPPTQGTNIPVAPAGNNHPNQKENKPDQNTTPITSKPILPQTQNSFPDSNKETTNLSDQVTTTKNPQPPQAQFSIPFRFASQEISAAPTQPQSIFQPNTGFNMLDPFQGATRFPFNNNIPGPVPNLPSFQRNTPQTIGQEKSENKQEASLQGSSQEISPPNQLTVGIGGKPPNTPTNIATTLQHPPTIHTKPGVDITEVNNKLDSINTRPSTEHTTPESGANDTNSSHSSFKDLVSQNSLNPSTNMADKDPSQPLEQINQLKSELEMQQGRINEAENKAGSLQEEKKSLEADITQIKHDLEQKKTEITAKDKENQNVSNELLAEKQKATGFESEKQKTTDELKASKKECEYLKTKVKQYSIDEANNKSRTQNLGKENQALTTKVAELESKSKNSPKELEAKQKELTKLKESHSTEIKHLKKTMEDSKAGDTEQKKILDAKESNLKHFQEELKSAQAAITKAESKHKDSAEEIFELKQQIVQLTNEDSKLKETISQLHTEKDQFEVGMNSCVDIDLLTKIEEVFICLSNQVPPHVYTPGSPDRVEWLVSSLTSWNAQLTEKISTTESLLHEKETEIDVHKAELQAILNFLQQHKPTNKGCTISSTSSPLKLIQAILSERTDQLSKAHVSRIELERYNKTMEVQIGETRQHYKDESNKNDQLMQDNADLERKVQRLTSEKEELEIKNVELINQLSATQSDFDILNEPSLQLQDANATLVQELLNPRPSPLPLGMMSPFPFEAPPLASPTAFSLSQGHRSTLQKAADELSHLKVRVWESEAENSKLREQLSARNKDPSLPVSISPDAESAFQAVFEANQSNLMKLAESNREKDLFSRDVEFLRQRVEDLEKSVERLKVSIEVKEVAYKELYLECREWERKYKKCGHVHQELDRVKRQLMRREAETQECATLRAERLNQQTTLDNLVAELQERKKAEQILARENQKLHAKLEETLQHISNMQSRIQEQTIIEPHRNPKPEELQQLPVPHPASPTILKPPSMSSIPLSPPTRQPATKRHPHIFYPPTSS